MLKIKPFSPEDGIKIASWITDESSFYLWSAGRMGSYPPSGDTICRVYSKLSETDGLSAFSAYDEDALVGSFTVRNGKTPYEKRLGFIILDPARRGCTYGQQMLSLASEMLFSGETPLLTLGVFEQNISAQRCYAKVGFKHTGETVKYDICGERWLCLEYELSK